MPLKNSTDPYLHVSKIYAHLMDFISYKWWAKYIYSITKKSLPKHPKVLELAAGTCSLANYLSKNYKDYFVSDISFQMLNKKHKLLNKICCDMIALPVKGKFDLVFSAFDSVNYLLTKKDLLKHFKQVSSILSDDGIYTFDVALVKNSYKHQKTAIKSGKTKGYLFKRESVFNPKTKIHKNKFSIIYPDGSLYKEIHTQKIFSFDTFFELAEKSGLYVVNCYKAFSFTKGKAESDRVQFIMKRKV